MQYNIVYPAFGQNQNKIKHITHLISTYYCCKVRCQGQSTKEMDSILSILILDKWPKVGVYTYGYIGNIQNVS